MRLVRKNRQASPLVLAATLVATALISGSAAHADVLYDNITAPGPFGIGAASTSEPPQTPNSWFGDAVNLAASASDITGVDLFVQNDSGESFNAFRGTIDIWGLVNTGTVNSSSPAFGDLLGSDSFGGSGNYPNNGGQGFVGNGGLPGLAFTNPIDINGASTIGISINIQWSNNGGGTFASYNNAGALLAYNGTTATGSGVFNGYYVNLAGESNGNFVTPLQSNGKSNQGIYIRIDGDSNVHNNWALPQDGSWTTGSNWTSGSSPDAGGNAYFNLSSSGYAVSIDRSVSVNNVYVENDTVSFDLDAQNSQIAVNKTLCIAAGAGQVGTLTLINSGGVYTGYAVPNAIIVGANGGTGTLNVSSGVYLYCNGSISIGAGSALKVEPFAKFGTATLTIAGSTGAWTGQLDIGNTALDLRNGSIATVSNQLETGFGNGTWTGQGIVSSAAAADTSHLTAVGAILNNDGAGNRIYGSGTALGLFDGDNPGLNSVLIQYTYYGDTNLDGVVDGSDYSRIDNGYLHHLTGWFNGDFNYDGVVDGSDYTLIDNTFNMQGNSLGGSSGFTPPAGATAEVFIPSVAASVPEPAELTALFLGAPLLARRRRRSSRETAHRSL
jgi:hypothetical protein